MATHFRTFAALVLVAFVGLGVASLFGYDVSGGADLDDLPGATPDGTATATPTPSAAERERWGTIRKPDVRTAFYRRLNDLRRDRSRMPVSQNGGLRAVAENHSADMAAEGYLATEDPDGGTAEERMWDAGIGCGSGREVVAAVRLAEGGPNGTRVESADALAGTLFDRWTDVREDRRVLLTIGATRAGLGLYATDDGRVYATLDVC